MAAMLRLTFLAPGMLSRTGMRAMSAGAATSSADIRQQLVDKLLGELEKAQIPPPADPKEHLSSNRDFRDSRLDLPAEAQGKLLFGVTEEQAVKLNPLARKLVSFDTASQADMNLFAKQQAITKFQRKAGDTGSPEVQIAILTTRINYLTDHMIRHRKDKHSRHGLLLLVEQRRKMLTYLRRKSIERYVKLIQELGIRYAPTKA